MVGSIKKFIGKKIIIDASVLLKVALNEHGRDFVKDLIKLNQDKQLTLLATQLIIFEFLNTLAKKLKNEELVQEHLKNFFEFEIGIIPHTYGHIEKAVKAACENDGVSYYDSSYHALAKEMFGLFLTADEKYYNQMKGEGNIVLLSQITI